MKLSLRAFESFRETFATGSVTAAADRIGITQSAVSRFIAQLERNIGFSLFYRDKGRLMPTSEAQILYDEVDLAFGSLDRLQGLLYDIAHYNAGQIRVVAPSGISHGVLAEILELFLELYPKVRVSVDSRDVAMALSMVATRAADCGYAKIPIARNDLDAEVLTVDETVCVIRADHPLARHDVLTPKLIGSTPLIMLGFGTTFRSDINKAFRDDSTVPNVRVETRTVASACAYAAKGLGLTLVNSLFVGENFPLGLVARRFEPSILNEYAFISSSLAPRSRLAEALLEVSRAYFSRRAAEKVNI